MRPSDGKLERVRDWSNRLYALQGEMEEANGEPSPGLYDNKLETLVRWAWHEASAEEARLAR